MARCRAQTSAGGSRTPLTKQEANAQHLLHWEEFTYAAPPRQGRTGSRGRGNT